MTFEAFDVVTVPFPFVDRAQSKRRPAVVLSSARFFNSAAGHSVFAMITSSKNEPWPLDMLIGDLADAGLHAPCVVRMKFFTLDNRLVLARIGSLSSADRESLLVSVRQVFDYL